MARENQGLHIALIIFVVLTLMLAISTFVIFSQYNEAKERAKKFEDDFQAERNRADDKEKLMKEFQKKMGFAPTDTPDKVRDMIEEDMKKYARDLEEQARVYREALRIMVENVNETQVLHEAEIQKVKEYEEDLANVNQLADKKIAEFESRAEAAEKDRNRLAKQFAEDKGELEDLQRQLANDLKQVKEDHKTVVEEMEGRIAKVTNDLKIMVVAYENAKNKVDKMVEEIPSRFHGEIRLVSQHGRTVWINRGSDDALRPQTKFSVFPANSNYLVETDKKASIEVTRVLKGHLAEARIVDDDPLDPILVGDKIYTPIWDLGEKQHFALVGLIDLDGDGRSDLERMHTLIEMNGGVVDARKDAQGRRHGKMTMDTRYLILGKEYDIDATSEARDDYNKMTDQADKLRVKTITLSKFLEMMGWVRQVKVAHFGSGDPGQFPVEKEVVPTVSHGQLSELFKPRKPSPSSKNSPY